MNNIDIQRVLTDEWLPNEEQFQLWLDLVLADAGIDDAEISVRIVGSHESASLNEHYRKKQGPTNILSFPFEIPENVPINFLGDLVICAPVLSAEARGQHKALENHWAHIVIHGVLHLLGYDHIDEQEAELMEAKEIALLAKLNIDNPYNEAYEV